MARRLSNLEVHDIKRLICEGFSQTDTARAMDVSQAIVSKICMGDVHRDIPWPNPEVGEKVMRSRGVRSDQDKAQAMLARGVPVIPAVQASQVIESTEAEAVQAAREKAAYRAGLTREIEKRVALIEEEDEKAYREKMLKPAEGKPDPNDPKKMPSIWEVKFLSWGEVIEKEPGLSIVQVAEEEGDSLIQRAIGIVFYVMDQEEWESQQTLQVVADVIKQLKLSQPDENKP